MLSPTAEAAAAAAATKAAMANARARAHAIVSESTGVCLGRLLFAESPPHAHLYGGLNTMDSAGSTKVPAAGGKAISTAPSTNYEVELEAVFQLLASKGNACAAHW